MNLLFKLLEELPSLQQKIDKMGQKLPRLTARLGKLFVFDRASSNNNDNRITASVPCRKYAFDSHWFIKNVSNLKFLITNERTLTQTKIEFARSFNALYIEAVKHPSLQKTRPSISQNPTVDLLIGNSAAEQYSSDDFKVECSGAVKLFAVFDVALPLMQIQARIRDRMCTLKLKSVKTTRSINILLSLFGVPKLFELLTKSFHLTVKAEETDNGTELHWDTNFILPSSGRCVAVLWKLGLTDMTFRFFKSIRKTWDALVKDLKRLKNENGMEDEEVEHSSIIYYAEA